MELLAFTLPIASMKISRLVLNSFETGLTLPPSSTVMKQDKQRLLRYTGSANKQKRSYLSVSGDAYGALGNGRAICGLRRLHCT
jgi:hypothetical protein